MDKNAVLLARQPIYNNKKEVAAYELLFRAKDEFDMPTFDGNRATSEVLLNAFSDNDIDAITNGLPAFVNFTKELLLNPPPFSPDHLVIEILEDIDITDEIINAVKRLKNQGFRIALDDFVMDEKYQPLLQLADYIKLELPAMTEAELQTTVSYLAKYKVTLLAEKIETHAEYNHCNALGCELFQGYFLSKPELVKGKKLPGNKLAILNLIGELQNPSLDVNKINQIITSDPVLSFKILRLVNSAAFKRSKDIESIHMAVMMLGLQRIKAWASLMALSKMDDKPGMFRTNALQRAKMCELIAEKIQPDDLDTYFTIGLLSSLDTFFDMPIREIVSSIPLGDTVKSALTHFKGKPGLALHSVRHYELANWQAIHWSLMEKLGLSAVDLNSAHITAIEWANQQIV